MTKTTHTARIALLAALIAAGALAAPMAQARGGDSLMRPSFEELDLNGDGSVTQEEIIASRTAAAEARFAAADTNGDGELSQEEMLAAADERRANKMERRTARMIERLDADGNGTLSAEEIAEGREGRRGGGVERIFERLDSNEDGVLDADEFEEARARMEERGGKRGGPRN